MPTDSEFKFECLHCGFGYGKTPKQIKDSGQDYKLYFCSQCKEATLIQYSGDVAAQFKVIQ